MACESLEIMLIRYAHVVQKYPPPQSSPAEFRPLRERHIFRHPAGSDGGKTISMWSQMPPAMVFTVNGPRQDSWTTAKIFGNETTRCE